MKQPQILHSPWPFYEDMSSAFDQVEHYGFNVDAHVGASEFNSLFTTLQYSTTSSEVSSIPFSSIHDHFHFHYPIDKDTLQLPSLREGFSMELDDFVSIQGYPYPEESEGSIQNFSIPSQHFSSEGEDAWSSTASLKSEISSNQPSYSMPQEDMEIENKVCLPHLLEAFAEAVEKGHRALAEEILRCISQKVSPVSEPLHRLAFYLSQHMTTNQGHYLKQEACKNFEDAFRAFYLGLPHGKFAHFAANSAIFEAIPYDSEVIHIVDFDMGEGVQWIPMLEAIARLQKTLKLTSIKWGEESSQSFPISTPWKFEETRRKFYEHARSRGFKLKMEEKGLEELVTEINKMNKRGGKREFLAFNFMVGLIGRGRSRKHAMEFLRAVKDLIKNSGNRGIITFGDGDPCEKLRNSLNFRSFLEGHLSHYQALLESVESHFPTSFSEARTAIECLFVAPYISSLDWLRKWEEMTEEEDSHLQAEIGLKGCRLGKAILMEAREILKGSEGSYEARIEGQHGNELVLEWRGTELVRVSTWAN